MKDIYRLFLILSLMTFSCTNKQEENDSLVGKTFRLINTDIYKNVNTEYCIFEFLENKRLISESSIDSVIILQQGNWSYYRSKKNEYLVLEELEGLIDTFKIKNKKFEYFQFKNKNGDILEFELLKEELNFDTSLIYNKNWVCINDSLRFRIDSKSDSMKWNYIYPKFQFFNNQEYEFLSRRVKKGNWRFNTVGNRIFIDSIYNNNEIIKIKKITSDSLFFWKRDTRQKCKFYKCIVNNSV